MPRTKMTRKKSSLMKKGKASMRQTSASVESLASTPSSVSSDPPDDFCALTANIYESPSQFRVAFEDYYAKKLDAKKEKYELCIKHVKDLFANIYDTYPESFLNAPLNSRYDEKILQELNIETNVRSARPSRTQAATSNEGFKKPATPRKSSRSSSRTSRKRSLSAPTPSAPSPQEFQTPLNNARHQLATVKTITPKVSNTPMSVMRRPQHGEVAFSTSGSPLLIGPVSREDIPTVNVPLQDGRVFSILPDPGMPPEDLPTFDDDTKKYLKTLREHLAMLSGANTSP